MWLSSIALLPAPTDGNSTRRPESCEPLRYDRPNYRYPPGFWQHRVVRLFLTIAVILTGVLPAEGQVEHREQMAELLMKTDTPLSAGEFGLMITEQAHGWRRVEVPVRESIQATIEGLARRLDATVTVPRRYELLGPESEPFFHEQWGLENTGQTGGVADADIDAIGAWEVTKGAGAVVAIIDSGIDPANVELDEQLWSNSDEVPGDGQDNDANGYVDDVNGWDFFENGDNDPAPEGAGGDDAHGTLIAGIVAAEVNGIGISGIAPEATIMNLRACDNGFCDSFDVLEAMVYAVDNGADIINLSFGAAIPKSLGDPVLEDAMDYALERGVLVVSAAGNTQPEDVPDDEIILPAEYPHANNVAVAASNRRDELADFSYYSPDIDIAAPGVGIVSTGLDGYYTVDGTSFSAPYVAGVAALLLAADPAMSYEESIDRIKGFADRPPAIGAKVESGRLNAERPLTRQFIDIVGHVFEADVEWLADQGITRGCNPPASSRFCPDDDVTRGQMAAFIKRYLDLPPATEDHFVDDDMSLFEDDINRLAEAGITRGCNPPNNDRFCPAGVVTRGQMAAFLVRAFDLSDDGRGDLFVDDDGSTFEHDIDILGTAGITKGCNPPDNDRFCPDQPVTRGAMAAFLHRAFSP